MVTPKVAQKAPYPIAIEAGKTYYWCTCGESAKQPFCDGSHKDTSFVPQAYTADVSKTAYFCGCKISGKAPFCDGSHNRL